IESLILIEGAGAINGTGNATTNAIIGNSADNIINGAGGDDTLIGNGGNDTFLIPDSAFASIDGGIGFDRITLNSPTQIFDLSANAAKISNVEVISLTASLGAALSLSAADIPIVNAAGNALYVIGGADDAVTANPGDTWILMATGQLNANLPGFVFNQY